ncbi:L-cystine uptake protein TcyP (sodium:dicarboxylate symporter family) [Bradyrhizobium embrapense]
MTLERAVIVILLAFIIALLAGGNTPEAFGIGLLVGLVLGAPVGAAFVTDRQRKEPTSR